MKTVLLWGGGSQARIIESMIEEEHKDFKVQNIFDPLINVPTFNTNVSFSNKLEDLIKIISNVSYFIMCIGSSGYARYRIHDILKKYNLISLPIISENAFIDKSVCFGEGIQVRPSAVLHKFINIGNQCIFNTNSTVDHECLIGNGVHIMPGATVAGRVQISDFVTIGSNATILPDLKIGEGAFIGAGSVIVQDVIPYSVMTGVPGKYQKRNKLIYDNTILKSLETI